MLKRLLLMRHAKSSWSDPELTDHQRPLNEQGERSATAIGQALTIRRLAPDLIWSSDSKRTSETAIRLIRAIPGAQIVEYISEFYHASPQIVLTYCQKQGEPDTEGLMLLGHNPGWAGLYEYYTGQSHKFPTAACCVLERKGSGDWLAPESWRAVDLILPRDLL